MKQSTIFAVLAPAALLCNVIQQCGALNLTHFEDFDRMSVGVDDRVQVCKPSQLKKAEPCIQAAIPMKVHHMSCGSGYPVPHTFYTTAIDTMALSQYIYMITKLREVANDVKSELYNATLYNATKASLEEPLLFRDGHDLLNNNINLIKDFFEVQEALEILDVMKNDEDLACMWNSSMGEDHEIIKFGDTKKDISKSRVHMITVNHSKKRVDVTFRGTARPLDWATNLNALWRWRVPNPVQYHQKNTTHIHLHRGFAEALLGKATSANDIACKDKDDGAPMQSILCDIKPFMKKEYKLFVTGHSLGGATATLFAFFAASTDNEITRAGPVNLYTYASPRVGGSTFQSAFKFLEERGKIRHARFRNKFDRVPMMPYLNGKFKHVGMEFRLRDNEIPVIDYPTDKNWTQKSIAFKEKASKLWEILAKHKVVLLLKRTKLHAASFNNTSLQQEYQMVWGM